MGFLDDVVKGVSHLGNDVLHAVDNGIGTNLSGRGPGGLLTNVGKEFNRSDVGRFVGRAGTDFGNVVKSPFIATSDLLRGDTEQAGRSLGKGIGSAARLGSAGTLYLAEDNKEKFRQAGKYTFGLTSDFAGVAGASRSAIEEQNISKADLNDTLRFGSKALAIGTGVYYAKEIGAGAQSAYQSTIGGAKAVGSSLPSLSTAKDVATIGLLAGAGKGTKAAEVAAKLTGLDEYLPQVPKLDPQLSDAYKSIVDASKGLGAVGGSKSYTPNQSNFSSGTTTIPADSQVKEAGLGLGTMALIIAGIYFLKKGVRQ